jgi:NAD(P)-dependent dehydrogenase (short-subunit alcohol dehydrogenase family)
VSLSGIPGATTRPSDAPAPRWRLDPLGQADQKAAMTQKIALITGASRGLGAALAEALAPTHHIIAVARTTGALEDLDDRIQASGGSATLAPMDITVPAAMATLCRGVHDRWGHLDLWLHTAIHAAPLSPATSVAQNDWSKSMAINATASSVLIPYVAPLLGQSGRAVFFNDPRAGEKFFGAYGASKAAQMALAQSWQAETVKTGPRVQILQPNPMPTALRARFCPGEDRAQLADIHAEASRLLPEILS